MPFSTITVIPDGWSRHHAAAAAGGMNATVTIGTPAAPTYDLATDETTTTWSTDYAGPARIQATRYSREIPSGGEQLTGRSYLVQLDFDTATAARTAGGAALGPRMRVLVTSAPNDADLVGQQLWVVDVQLGSERFTRDLVCSDNQSDVPAIL